MGSTTALYPALKGLYSLRETIGSGGFAKVKKAIHLLTGEKCAIKIMDKKSLGDDLPRVYLEIEAMKDLSHQNIAKLYQVIETTSTIFMVLEYCPGGELFDYIVAKNKLPEDEARVFFRQIVAAVGYIHKRGYAHRDLKPENLLLDKDHNAKLIDFGLCAKPQGGMENVLKTCCGSPAYAAPELVTGKEYLGAEADLWSMGVLLYALLCGYLPFDDDNISNLYRKIQSGHYTVPEFVSQKSSDLIAQLLQVEPKRRITIDQLLKNSWLCKFDGEVKWESSISQTQIDPDCCGELSLYYGKSLKEMSHKIREWKYEYLTASYLLLRQKKAAGRSVRLAASHIPRPLGELKPRSILGDGIGNSPSLNRRPASALPGQHPKIMQPSIFNSPNQMGRSQPGRQSARPAVAPPAVPAKAATLPPQMHPSQMQPMQPPPAFPMQPPGAPRLPPKMAARHPSVMEDDEDDKENFIVPQGRASRSVRTTPQSKPPPRGSHSQPRPRPASVTGDENGHRSSSTQSHQRRPKPVIAKLNFDENQNPPKQIIPQQLSEDMSPTDIESQMPTFALSTPCTPTKTTFDSPFDRAVTPSKSLDSGLDSVDGSGTTPSTPANRIIRRRSNSIDTSSMPRKDGILWTPGSATKTPMSSMRPPGSSVFGSIERGLDKMKAALTPRKRFNSDADSVPRRINALVNLSYTSKNSAATVLEDLKAALEDKKIQFKQTDYILRCKITDDWDRIKLAFDLEICEMPSRSGEKKVGIRRKRVKGDTWMFKRYCEDILSVL